MCYSWLGMETTVTIPKRILGSQEHLVIPPTGDPVPVSDIPEDSLVLGSKSWDEIVSLYKIPDTQLTFPPEPFRMAYKSLPRITMAHSPPWSVCIPYKAYRQAVGELVVGIRAAMSSLGDLGYYRGAYKKGNEVFSRLERVAIDVDRWKEEVQRDQSGILKSFVPGEDGFCELPVYDRTESVTGRSKVKSGANILNLYKTHRNLLRSRFGSKGGLWSVDYSALEPRVLLSLSTNGTLPKKEQQGKDLYATILTNMFGDHTEEITRDVVKKVVLSLVYGAGVGTLEKELPGVRNIYGLVEQVEEFFCLPAFKQRLNQEVEQYGHLTTRYGRRVSVTEAQPYMYPNRVTQSSAVDVSLLGFLNILDLVVDLGMQDRVVPVFVLHDALILDIHENAVNILPALCKIGSRDIEGFEEMVFYLKPERFNTK